MVQSLEHEQDRPPLEESAPPAVGTASVAGEGQEGPTTTDVRESGGLTIRVAFQGERGAFGDEAVRAYFGPVSEPQPYRSFADVFHAVAAGAVDYGLVPVENSQAGSINEVYDLLRQYDLFVIGEISLPVNHCLLCLPGQQLSDIKRVISHPQALAQSEAFLRELGVEVVASYDTAGSAKMIREQNLRGVAAVAGAAAAELYGLQILAEGIQTIKDNHTRFIALGRDPAPRREGPAKTMIVMATPHQPGALYRCLGVLAERGINLLKLESRPSRQRVWEYVFYLDFEGHRDDPAVRSALADLAQYTTFCKVLGSFPRRI
ncbi:MAG: prephenate dehydratase [Thermogemmatispora sp.]|jgi:prephenate dehydratase|uniref:Prephenate dehydratase n=1 Tax=Thermogemmatispora aurantia TaxID=2045279 RepID=A0A5J4JXQ7_9CHLR|nr:MULTISPECIES: prephenate dehydratase [Thermogemmatispora]MBE3566829.1 prephenate dehydratase [Thermogemmatispora sp.]GER82098.1 prephenate dehydratase [Thermogemmatispora aurantia]